VVSVDTLRSDRLPFYGFTGVETPALSALRADSILFESAWTHVPLTLPSHASLFTGRQPGEHGVRDNAGYALSGETPTLAELLKAAGYATGGAVSAYVLSARSGIARGFDFWDDAVEQTTMGQAMSQVQRPGTEAEAALSAWIDRLPEGKPFFAFLHLFEPHSPYDPPEPFRTRYASDPYAGEVAAADAIVGAFLAKLKAHGLYEKSLVVFLSDHGEGLGDHGEKEHGIFLYREALQVPLLVKLPGNTRSGALVKAPVQLTDLFETAGRELAVKRFPTTPGLVSLAALARGVQAPERRIFAETFFPRIRFGWSELESVLDGRHHYIEAPTPELYDLVADPEEKSNLAPDKPAPLRSLKAELERKRIPFRGPGAVDAEHTKKLAALGYVSARPPSGDEGRRGRPDPKDVIGTLEPLREGLGFLQSGRPAEAAAALRKILAANPEIRDAWELLAQAELALGRGDAAVAAARRVVELSPPGSTNALLAVANIALQAGRTEEGIRNAEAARELGDSEAEEVLARGYLAAGDLASAEEAANRALAGGRPRKRSLLVLARVAVLRGDLPRALALADEVKALVGEKDVGALIGFHYLRGDALARLGRVAEAEEEFAQEIRLFPTRADARVSLVGLYAATGREEDAERGIRAILENVPGSEGPAAAIASLEALGRRAAAEDLRRQAAARFPGDPRFSR
jgi:arylsulfatase A-like enzyme/tetratricopeptide (TPR) repeat protein